jgi:cation transport regulator ChaC
MTEHDSYIVGCSGQGWVVRLNHETLATFTGRHEALQAAVVVAEASGRAGKTAEVLSEEDGEIHSMWEVGRDAYSVL